MIKHIGIIGVSSEGAALCYRTICQEASVRLGQFIHPEISVHTYPLNEYMKHIERDDWNGVATLLLSSVKKVAGSGAEFSIIPDNTVHRVFEEVSRKAPVPLISIVETVVKEIKRKQYKTVGLLGTIYTMRGPVYETTLEESQINLLVPDENQQNLVNSVIFNELIAGSINETSRHFFLRIIEEMRKRECEAVILGCTEIPLLVDAQISPLPVLDSTKLLAREALNYAIKQ
jgi:aspartate racemase